MKGTRPTAKVRAGPLEFGFTDFTDTEDGFIARRLFAERFKRLETDGGDPTQTMRFVWYLDDGEPSPDPAQS